MEGHSANFWNEIADQTQRNDGKEQQKSTKNRSKIYQNRSKIGLGSALGASWGHLPPKRAPRAQKMPKTAFAEPPRIQVGSQNPCKIDPEAFQMQFFLYLFSGRVRTPLWADLLRIRVRKWSKNRPKIDVQSDLAENAKSLKKLRFSQVF